MAAVKEETVFSAQEVAELLRIKKSTVYNLIKRGELVAYRIGNKVRISDQEVENYKKRAMSVSDDRAPFTPQPEKRLMGSPTVDEPAQNAGGFIICGQDSALDTLANQLQGQSDGAFSPLRSYVGSYNGLYMLYQGQASIASAHLWDGRQNVYNIPYVERMLPGVPAVVIHLFRRTQGFYVLSGNPKGIRSWDDLGRNDIVLCNREKGSGTRVLLDEHLRIAGIPSSQVSGYRRECFSHLAVAGVVAKGGADFGIGTQSAVRLFTGLEFVPVQEESYDLVIKKEDLGKPTFAFALEVIRSQEYRSMLQGMGDYDLRGTGSIIAET